MMSMRFAFLTCLGAVALCAPGASAASAANVVKSVSPSSGGTGSAFVVNFTRGLLTDEDSGDFIEINVTPPAGSACDTRHGKPRLAWEQRDFTRFGPSRKATLAPRGTLNRRTWCRGLYRGQVVDNVSNPSSSCEEDNAPASCNSTTVLGTFTFRVR